MSQVIIIGGGLAGLIASLVLSKAGIETILIEKKVYPFHKVCGEYISNEVLPFLEKLQVGVQELNVSRINRFLLSSPSGKSLELALEMGGFGVSRFTLDHFLYKQAVAQGVKFLLGSAVESLTFEDDQFLVRLSNGNAVKTSVLIGAYGKRSKLDKNIGRTFINKSSPYIGVKYHIIADFPSDMVALHNFPNGYCGISKVEDGIYNLCYLSHRNNLKAFKDISEMEKNVLYKNPYLKDLFLRSEFLFTKPEVINEISFEGKTQVQDHILFAGDSAGMIAPLCGNGMAMAIHSGKIVAECVIDYFFKKTSRSFMENQYEKRWQENFKGRLWIGRNLQKMFGSELVSEIMVKTFKASPALSRFIVRQTHGKPF